MALIKRFGTCSKDCYGGCVFHGYWNDSSDFPLQKTTALKDHPFTQGVFCGKLSNRIRYLYHPDRLKHPLITHKKGSGFFDPIPLNDAYTLITAKIKEISQTFGGEAILGAYYSGNVGLISQYSPLRFFNALGATTTTGGICNEGGCAGLNSLFGTYSTTNPLQLNNRETHLIVVWGSNLTDNNTHAYLLIRKARKHGVKLVVLDSRKTQIAREADIFIPTLPGTDHIIARYISHKLSQSSAIDMTFLRNHVDGYESLIREINEIDCNFLDSVHVCSLGSLDKINSLIRLLHQYQHHSIFNIGYGVQKDLFGGQIVQSIALIQTLLGNLGKPGTGIIYSQSDFNKSFSKSLLDYITQSNDSESSTRSIHLLKLGNLLNTDKIKILFIYNFNPASSLPNQSQFRKGLMRNDIFIVVLDQFLNETTKFADIVIPAKFDVETYDLVTPYYYPGISLIQAGPCPYTDCVSNHEFFQNLGSTLNLPMKIETNEDIFRKCIELLPERLISELEKKGYTSIFKGGEVPFSNLKFPTPNKKIDSNGPHFLFKSPILSQLTNLASNQFLLITPNKNNYLHSQLGYSATNNRGISNMIFLNSFDCNKLEIIDGDFVEVKNNFTKAKFRVSISEMVISKTAIIYHGLYTDYEINANYFTSEHPEALGNSGAYNSSIVSIIR